jgi:cell filamentation protein, protein adenylyltransferase
VLRYRQALMAGFEGVRSTGLLTLSHILAIQETLENNRAGFRKLPGTVLKDPAGNTVYTPPQHPQRILDLMADLERFINDDGALDLDPLIKMAIVHHQFESIHPFYDGNGRTGRIVNVLYLVQKSLLDIPVLYLSRYIVRTKGTYYTLLQKVREDDAWEEWIQYMLEGVEDTARDAIATIKQIAGALLETKHQIRANYKFYSQDLVNNLYMHPYTKIQFVERDLGVTRLTATKYLDELAGGGILLKEKIGRTNYYMNVALVQILTGQSRSVNA